MSVRGVVVSVALLVGHQAWNPFVHVLVPAEREWFLAFDADDDFVHWSPL